MKCKKRGINEKIEFSNFKKQGDMMSEEYVKLWTRQDIRSLDDLHRHGVFRNKREYIESNYGDISDHFISLYKWFVLEASKVVPKPEGVEFPIWCSVSEESMLRPVEDTVCFELEIPKSKVIYFDGSKWDYVLNHIYIPEDDEDQKIYLEDLKRRGFKNEFGFLQGSKANLYPLEKRKIMDSWKRVFQIDKWNIFIIQGNIWEIRPEHIKNTYLYK